MVNAGVEGVEQKSVCYNRSGGGVVTEQNFANHTKLLPPFHFFVLPVMFINFGWSIYRWKVTGFSLDGFERVLLAAALLVGFIAAATTALKVQDRVLRLEDQLRYERVLPAHLQARIPRLTVAQLI